MSGGNTREAKALLKMSENSCTKRKIHFPRITEIFGQRNGLRNDFQASNSFLHAVKSNCSHLVQSSNSHLLEIPVWAYDGHMGTVTVGGWGMIM